jgi:hypothetical protein
VRLPVPVAGAGVFHESGNLGKTLCSIASNGSAEDGAKVMPRKMGKWMREYPVPFETWKIGMEFFMSGNRYRVTDVGSRTVVAICIEPGLIVVATKSGHTREELSDMKNWLDGPPYAVVEHVMDEHDLPVCYLEKLSEE